MFKNFISLAKCITFYRPCCCPAKITFSPIRLISAMHQFKFNDVIKYPKREIPKERIDLPIEQKTLPQISDRNSSGKKFYEILGVRKNATQQDIKKAYYVLAKKLHPDSSIIYRSPESDRKFQELSEAYRVLSDESKRREYDLYGIANSAKKTISDATISRSERLLHKIFTDAGFARESKEFDPPVNIETPEETTIKLTFAQSVLGGIKSIPVRTQRKCHACSGANQSSSKKNMVMCKKCSGAGFALSVRNGRTPCKSCNGLRFIPQMTCSSCKGRGTIVSNEQIEVNIAPGIKSGEVIRISKPNTNQQIALRILIDHSDEFKRNGNDILSIVPITLAQAVLGGSVKVKGIDGKTNIITLQPGTESDTKMRLIGKGVRTDSNVGDHIVTLKTKMPKILTVKQRALMTAFGNLENDEASIKDELRNSKIREELANLHNLNKRTYSRI